MGVVKLKLDFALLSSLVANVSAVEKILGQPGDAQEFKDRVAAMSGRDAGMLCYHLLCLHRDVATIKHSEFGGQSCV